MESELKDFPVIDACQTGWVERIMEFYWPQESKPEPEPKPFRDHNE
jgi:hypothetical protein